MKLEELKEEWQKDSEIDEARIGYESLKTPKLHSKYLNFLTDARFRLRQQYEDRVKLKSWLEDYYLRRLPAEEYKKRPLKFPEGVKPIQSTVKKYIESDDDYIKKNLIIGKMEEKVAFLEEVMKAVNARNWHIRNFIEYQKFMSGIGG